MEAEEPPAALPAGGTPAGPAAAGLAAASRETDVLGARASLWAGQALEAALGRWHGSMLCGLRGLRASAALLSAARAAPVRLRACVWVPGLALLAAMR